MNDPSLNYPVIDTGLQIVATSTHLEEYVAAYGGPTLVDELRAAARVRGCDAAPTFDPPEHQLALRRARGSDHCILFPCTALAGLAVSDPVRRHQVHHAVNHYHADLWHRHRARLTPVAGIPLTTPREALGELEFAVKRLGYKAIGVELDDVHTTARHDPFWARVVELGVPVFTRWSEASARALVGSDLPRRFPRLRVGLLPGGGGPGLDQLPQPWTDNLFLGCESAPETAGPGTNPIYSSPAGRRGPGLASSWRLVEDGLIDEDAFRAYVFANPYRLCTEANPAFFEGTTVEAG